MLQIDIAAHSELGGRSQNEDDLRHGGNDSRWYAVLSDGAGGHDGGAIAADLTVRVLALQLQSAADYSAQALHEAVLEAHAAVRERQHRGNARERMHATAVVLWLDASEPAALWSHVGDSRLYHLRRGRVRHMTRDDSLVQQLMDAGHLTPEAARSHPLRNQLLSAMGADHEVEPHTLEAPLSLQDGDAFLLASDGWWEAFDDAAIESSFAAAHSAQDWLEMMARRLHEVAHPGQDNFSAVAVWVGDPAQNTRIEID